MDAQVSHGWWALASDGIYFAGMRAGAGSRNLQAIQYFSFETRRVTDVSRIDGRIQCGHPGFLRISPDERILYGRIDLANTTIMLVDHFR